LDHKEDLARRLDRSETDHDDECSLLLLAWRRWGIDALGQIEGDFAVAIWDPLRAQLILARDALGHRPLNFRILPWGIAFGSTAVPLACLDGKPQPDLDRLAALLTFVPEFGPRTFVAGVERVIPGHALIVNSDGAAEHRRWWAPSLHPVPRGYDEAIAAMRLEIHRAVSAALESDSPVIAAQLSGGHDSSLVVATASELAGPGQQLIAITGDGSGERAVPADSFDEVEVATATARMMPNVRHLIASAAPESPLEAVDRWSPAEHAILNPYSLGWLDRTYSEAAKAGAKVMLVGYSGNYAVSHVGGERFPILARGLKLRPLLREWKAHRRRHGATLTGLLSMTVGPWIPTGLWTLLAKLRGRSVTRFDERAFVRPRNEHVRAAMHFARTNRLMTAVAPPRIFNSELRFTGLRWQDYGPLNHWVRAQHGIELRDPLGARRLLELSLSLDAEHFYRDGESRRLSKALLRGRVAERVYAESRRGMQSVNWLEGVRSSMDAMAEEVELIAADPELRSLFDVDQMRRRLKDWPADGWSNVEQGHIYRDFLTTAICVGRWARRIRERECA
jgi:asparagine synthase (glutamine-hydrolysing)